MKSVSVVIPSIGRLSIFNAIDSVLCQSLEPEQIIVILSSPGIQSTLVNRYGGRANLEIHINPGGTAASNRNLGILLTTADFVAFLDDDDFWHPKKLEIQMHYTSHDVISCKAKFVGFLNGVRPTRLFEVGVLSSLYPSRIPIRRKFSLPTPTLVIRSSIARDVLFDERLKEREDIWFLHKLEEAGCKFVQIEDVLVTVNTRKPLSDRQVSLLSDIDWFTRLERVRKGLGANFFWGVALRNRAFAGDFKGLFKLIIWYSRNKG